MSKGLNKKSLEFMMWLSIIIAILLFILIESLNLLGICFATIKVLGLCP